jgi:predicted RNA-binding protein with PIN domain
MKKTYSVTIEDEAVVAFIEEMCKRYRQPKSRILLASLYAFMKQQAIPNTPDMELDVSLTYGDISELKTRMNQLEARMSEFHNYNPEKIPTKINNMIIVNRPEIDDDNDSDRMPF